MTHADCARACKSVRIVGDGLLGLGGDRVTVGLYSDMDSDPRAPQDLRSSKTMGIRHSTTARPRGEELVLRGQSQGVRTQEGRWSRALEGSLRHVEVLVTGCLSGSPTSLGLDPH